MARVSPREESNERPRTRARVSVEEMDQILHFNKGQPTYEILQGLLVNEVCRENIKDVLKVACRHGALLLHEKALDSVGI
jgi:hypothetical protein